MDYQRDYLTFTEVDNQRDYLTFTAKSMKARESVDIPDLNMNDRRSSRRSSLSSDRFGLTDTESIRSSSKTRSVVSEPVELWTYGTKKPVHVRDTSGHQLVTIPKGSVVHVSNMNESGTAYMIQRPAVGWIFQADHVTKYSNGTEDVNDWDEIIVPIEQDQIDVPEVLQFTESNFEQPPSPRIVSPTIMPKLDHQPDIPSSPTRILDVPNTPVELWTYGTKKTVYVRDTSGHQLVTIPKGSVVHVSNMNESGTAYMIQRPAVGWIFQADHVTKYSNGTEDVNDWDEIIVEIEQDQIDVPGCIDLDDLIRNPAIPLTQELHDAMKTQVHLQRRTICFPGGPIGVLYDPDFNITEVDERTVAERNGVQTGWRMIQLNDEEFVDDVYQTVLGCGGAFTLTFFVEARNVDARSAPVPASETEGLPGLWIDSDSEEENTNVEPRQSRTGRSQTGRVKTWIADRGFGFIRPTGANSQHEDIFVHFRDLANCRDELYIGENVQYDIEDRNGKAKAVNVVGDHRRIVKKTGRVRNWIADRGFGFIRPTGSNSRHDSRYEDVFVHARDLADGRKELYVGENVQYIEINGRNGKAQAVNVVGQE